MVVLLTRKCHEDGVWITRLMDALKARRKGQQRVAAGGQQRVGSSICHVLAVEDLLLLTRGATPQGGDPISRLLRQSQFRGHVLVNRVSDAADPATVKFTISLLQAARLMGFKVFNGPLSYSLCVSKWCHHVVLDRAGLAFPDTRLVALDALIAPQSDCDDDNHGAVVAAAHLNHDTALLPPFPLLLKPNAGGFGRGIQRIESFQDLQTVARLTGETEPVLLQTYVEPKDQQIYRVWFLQGRGVQCAVSRTIVPFDEFRSGCVGGNVCRRPMTNTVMNTTSVPAVSSGNEFSSGCFGGTACSSSMAASASVVVDEPTTPFRAWKVPDEVVDEVQRIVQVLEDAHAGSVEFLYGRHDGKRYYFDVNLLSTLPLPETISNRDEVWSSNYDPWDELAAAIVEAENQ